LVMVFLRFSLWVSAGCHVNVCRLAARSLVNCCPLMAIAGAR
jgi:hypothetical protein